MLWCSVALAWCGAAATAALFAVLGQGLDRIAEGTGLSSRTVITAVALLVVAALVAGLGLWLSQWAASASERRLRQAVVSRVFQSGSTSAEGRSGSLLALATGAVERTAQYRAAFLGPIFGALSTPILVLGLMAATVDPVIAAWLAAFIVLVPLTIGGFQRLVRPIGAAYRRSQARLTASFLEAIQALQTLVYFRAAGRTAARLARTGEEHRKALMRLLAGNQLIILVVDAAFSLTVVVTGAALALTRVAEGSLSLGGAVAVILMTTLVVGPVDVVGQFFYIGMAGRATQRQLSAYLSGAPHRPSPAAPAAPAEAVGRDERGGGVALELDSVAAAWPGGAPVLRDVSFQVRVGERVALVGPSGVGKSTVSALLQAQLLPSSGRVVVDGLDTRSADPREVRARLAVVEQSTFLFVGSVAENLRLASPDATDAQLWAALDVAGLRGEVEAMARGLDTPVGEHASLLSGGQAQRLAIARAALRDAPILILDEPTSQVDLSAEAAILDSLDRLAAGRTVLMIAHRPGAILAADRVVELTSTGVRT